MQVALLAGHWQASPVQSGRQLHLPQTQLPCSGPEHSLFSCRSQEKLSHSQNSPFTSCGSRGARERGKVTLQGSVVRGSNEFLKCVEIDTCGRSDYLTEL